MKNTDFQMQFITILQQIHKEMSVKSVLTHDDFVRELASDGEIRQLLEEIWSEAQDKELQRELTKEEKTLPHPLSEQLFQDRFWRRRPDGLAVNWNDKAIFVLKFTRSGAGITTAIDTGLGHCVF